MKKPTQELNVQVNIQKLTLYQDKLKVGFKSVQFVIFFGFHNFTANPPVEYVCHILDTYAWKHPHGERVI